MRNSNNGIDILEQQIADNEDICCSCGNINSFPEAFFDRFRIADVGIIVCTSGRFTLCCKGMDYEVNTGETAFLSHGVCFSVADCSADCSVVIILYRVDSIRFVAAPEQGSAYDDLGATALDGLRSAVQSMENEAFSALWMEVEANEA